MQHMVGLSCDSVMKLSAYSACCHCKNVAGCLMLISEIRYHEFTIPNEHSHMFDIFAAQGLNVCMIHLGTYGVFVV